MNMSEDKLNPAKDKEDFKQNFSDNIWIAFQALIIAILFRSLLFQPFSIPSGSMLPTLLIGDYLFVSKYSYGYSKHSLPFSPPLFSDRIMGQDVTRGDVIVFKLPRDNRTDYIKRVVGLPGDTIQVQNGQLYLNGSAVAREKIEDFVSPQADGENLKITQYVETLPNGVRYRTLDLVENGRGDNTAIFNVPQGYYFVMGDNRDNSMDSRFSRAVGFVPYENIVGRAEVKFFSVNHLGVFWRVWEWPVNIRWARIFEAVE